jgi:adenosylcobinamide-phosphate synthase
VWAYVGGAPAVLAHRAANTLDAMVGHRSPRYEHFGWASARLDDVANWVPARVAAALVMIAVPRRASCILSVVRRDAPQHPSPNGGVIEAAFASALGISLGGTNRYGPSDSDVEERGLLGDGPSASTADIAAAVSLARRIEWLCVAIVPAVLGVHRAMSKRITP